MFITFEGIDRSGKSTQAALLAEALGASLVREPGGTEAGERVRALLKDPTVALDPRAELMLFSAARAQLIAEVIEPRTGDVVCDRFVDSTVAYQGAARGLGVELVEEVNALVVGESLPDLTVLLRIDVDAAVARGAEENDRFEVEGVEFQRAVAAAYDELAERHPERIVTVDGTGEPADVHARIVEIVEGRR